MTSLKTWIAITRKLYYRLITSTWRCSRILWNEKITYIHIMMEFNKHTRHNSYSMCPILSVFYCFLYRSRVHSKSLIIPSSKLRKTLLYHLSWEKMLSLYFLKVNRSPATGVIASFGWGSYRNRAKLIATRFQ